MVPPLHLGPTMARTRQDPGKPGGPTQGYNGSHCVTRKAGPLPQHLRASPQRGGTPQIREGPSTTARPLSLPAPQGPNRLIDCVARVGTRRHNRLNSRVRQNSSRKTHVKQKPHGAARGAVRLILSLKAKTTTDTRSEASMPPAQESRASSCICHRPNGRGGKNESSAQTSAPSGRQTTQAVISDGDRPTSHPQT